MKFQDDISNIHTYIHTYIHQSWGHKMGVLVGSGWGVRVDVNEELKFLRKFKKIGGGGGGVGRGWSGWGIGLSEVRLDVNEELKFL